MQVSKQNKQTNLLLQHLKNPDEHAVHLLQRYTKRLGICWYLLKPLISVYCFDFPCYHQKFNRNILLILFIIFFNIPRLFYLGRSTLRNNILHDDVADGASLVDLSSFHACLYCLRYDRIKIKSETCHIFFFPMGFSSKKKKYHENCPVNLHYMLVKKRIPGTMLLNTCFNPAKWRKANLQVTDRAMGYYIL